MTDACFQFASLGFVVAILLELFVEVLCFIYLQVAYFILNVCAILMETAVYVHLAMLYFMSTAAAIDHFPRIYHRAPEGRQAFTIYFSHLHVCT